MSETPTESTSVRAQSLALARASALGAACAMRSFSGPAALALRGSLGGPNTRKVVALLSAGEFVGDKNPKAPSRSNPPALAFRIGTGALSGRTVGGASGACVGGATAAVMTFATERARRDLGSRLHLPDQLVAVAEDALVITTAFLATGGGPRQVRSGGTAPTTTP